jgi:hypothetical protein
MTKAMTSIVRVMGIVAIEQRINETLSQMYFERWGLLAPPSGKARSEGYVSLPAFPHQYYTSTVRGVQHGRTGVLACKKLSLFLTRHDETSLGSIENDISALLDILKAFVKR